eukprot:gnl/MRDRNA2_/MRDRNA2_205183_c0_seq1.p1 gnl/MRDRNA2_/MRDRNA2_205183_c0~~gnl/MRDRNA2_/MRDRNA2_205183_c0_seq1.p1  ORF type:complete len:287 (+),score=56.46 gnl/MRDRNA2_/MRDRNA2_205183_c0_seq1:85-945(+)
MYTLKALASQLVEPRTRPVGNTFIQTLPNMPQRRNSFSHFSFVHRCEQGYEQPEELLQEVTAEHMLEPKEETPVSWTGNEQKKKMDVTTFNSCTTWADEDVEAWGNDSSVDEDFNDFNAGTVTTVVIKGIPKTLTQTLLRRSLDEAGFEGLFDFIYVPWVFSKPAKDGKIRRANASYAFVNFVNPEAAAMCHQVFQGHPFQGEAGGAWKDSKFLQVQAAKIQGLYDNLKSVIRSRTNHIKNKKYRPLVLKNNAIVPWSEMQNMMNCGENPTDGVTTSDAQYLACSL